MGLSSREYVLKLLSVTSESLGVKYTKQTPTTLQNWARENEGAFVANVSIKPSRTPINKTLDYISFEVGLFFVVSREYDLTEEDKTQQENEAYKLSSDFLQLLKMNEDSETVQTGSVDTIFREGGYLGLGCAGVYTISLADRNNYCDLFCNTMTKDVSCDS
jgi:hypothetical protein